MQFTVVAPNGKALPDAGTQVTVGFGSTASVAAGLYVTLAPLALVHSRVRLPHVSVGGLVSRTVTVNEHDAVRAALSVAVQFTVAVPSAKTLPDAGAQLIAGLNVQSSVAVTVKETDAPLALAASAVWLPGHVMTGGV